MNNLHIRPMLMLVASLLLHQSIRMVRLSRINTVKCSLRGIGLLHLSRQPNYLYRESKSSSCVTFLAARLDVFVKKACFKPKICACNMNMNCKLSETSSTPSRTKTSNLSKSLHKLAKLNQDNWLRHKNSSINISKLKPMQRWKQPNWSRRIIQMKTRYIWWKNIRKLLKTCKTILCQVKKLKKIKW